MLSSPIKQMAIIIISGTAEIAMGVIILASRMLMLARINNSNRIIIMIISQ